MEKLICGKVAKVIDEFKVVINKGSDDGVAVGQRYLVYYLGNDIIDPDTQESLGVLEVICGEGKVQHIQNKMTTLISDMYNSAPTKRIIKRNPFALLRESVEETMSDTTMLPFEYIDKPLLAKRIK